MASEVEPTRADRPLRMWDWLDVAPMNRWFEGLWPFRDVELLRIEQHVADDAMVVRAEIPGIDPDKDVEITVDDGVLNIRAERRSETKQDENGRVRSEFRYGSFSRTITVPKETEPDDVTATYKDGILEVRFPYKVPTEAAPRKVTVTKS
jgi:HSP20 family protein